LPWLTDSLRDAFTKLVVSVSRQTRGTETGAELVAFVTPLRSL
jgi:hypothetical protein